MKLTTIRSTISTSSRDDWHVITCWGGNGPSFLTSFDTWTGYQGEERTWGLEVETHTNIAVYREDVDLRIAWGWDPDHHTPDRDLSFPWQSRFTDSKVTRFFADIFWNGSLVDRMLMFGVDGGRALLPCGEPIHAKDSSTPHGVGEWTTDNVNDWEHDFTRLLHSFEHTEDFDHYFARAGFTRV